MLVSDCFEVYQKEEKSVRNRGQRTVGLHHMGALPAKLSAFDIMPTEEFIVSICKNGKISLKKRYADTCKCQKRDRIISDFRVVHPFYNVLITRVRA